jgi:hypothetical protein
MCRDLSQFGSVDVSLVQTKEHQAKKEWRYAEGPEESVPSVEQFARNATG